MNNKKKIILILVSIILCPVIIAIATSIKSPFNIETNNDWIGFSASYVGSLIGVLGVFLVMNVDRKQREKERRDNMFYENIEIYKSISKFLNKSLLNEINEDINLLMESDQWMFVASTIKNELRSLKIQISKCDEEYGLWETLRSYVYKHLHDEMKVSLNAYDSKLDEDFEYENMPMEIVDTLISIMRIYMKTNVYGQEYFKISISKKQLLDEFKRETYTKGYEKQIDSIHEKIIGFSSSKERTNYIHARSKTYKKVKSLSHNINKRVEELFNY